MADGLSLINFTGVVLSCLMIIHQYQFPFSGKSQQTTANTILINYNLFSESLHVFVAKCPEIRYIFEAICIGTSPERNKPRAMTPIVLGSCFEGKESNFWHLRDVL